MNPHLIPNKPHIKKGTESEENLEGSEENRESGSMPNEVEYEVEKEEENEENVIENEDNNDNDNEETKGVTNEMSIFYKQHIKDNQRRRQLVNLIASLETEMTEQLNKHKLFLEDISKIEAERNLYYGMLRQVEEICENTPEDCEAKKEILNVLAEEPEDFKCVTSKK